MRVCKRNPYHVYPSHLWQCPWCAEERTKKPFFMPAPPSPLTSARSLIDRFWVHAITPWRTMLRQLWSRRHVKTIAGVIALLAVVLVIWPRGETDIEAPTVISTASSPLPQEPAPISPAPSPRPAEPALQDFRMFYTDDNSYACTVRARTREEANRMSCRGPREIARERAEAAAARQLPVLTLYTIAMGRNPQGVLEQCQRAAPTQADAEAACGPKWQTYRRDFADGSACTLQARTQQEANAARCQTFIPAQIAQSARRLGEWYPPAYPRREEERGRTACVTVQFDVSREGNTTNIRVLSDVSAAFADAAYDAIAAQRFEPARTTTGVAVAESGLQRTVKFELPDEPAPC